ncbi:MAG TPA: UDP-N-acetylmuramate--L-alanine ligase [Burkholderiales bacterium]|nr:UDP-N-acetylmuramate--L-alanine ligase [Burkholderiales bacterium]
MKHKVKRIHFVGVGGSGMSGIAEVLLNLGYRVSGSDLAANVATERLASLGATVTLGHSPDSVASADAVVVSTAVPPHNVEIVAAKAKRIPVVPRAQMLAELMRLKQGIAVAGTHGKTTTTSLIASVLAEGGLDPTFVIGGRLVSAASNARLGAGDFIVAEADESDGSFLQLQPVAAVVTNIDADHMETYQHDLVRLKQAFIGFLQNLPFYGSAILCADDLGVREIMPLVAKPIVTYGLREEAMVRGVDIATGERMRFKALREGAAPLEIVLNLPGRHNVQNALAAVAVATELGVPDAAIRKALAEFRGVGRRFQRYGEVPLAADGKASGSFTLVDDYGHHPAEMRATVDAARGAFPGRRIVLAFQPHRYTRTRDLFEDFVKALSGVDALLLADVYPAGEPPIAAADGRSLAEAIRLAGKVEPVFVEKIAHMPEAIRKLARAGDVVLTMGAGSIGGVPGALLKGGK